MTSDPTHHTTGQLDLRTSRRLPATPEEVHAPAAAGARGLDDNPPSLARSESLCRGPGAGDHAARPRDLGWERGQPGLVRGTHERRRIVHDGDAARGDELGHRQQGGVERVHPEHHDVEARGLELSAFQVARAQSLDDGLALRRQPVEDETAELHATAHVELEVSGLDHAHAQTGGERRGEEVDRRLCRGDTRRRRDHHADAHQRDLTGAIP